ncbi:MAG: DUF3168 domain-containing protein [Alphaproteobacteria bacterium]|nr:DUF3168 domain-containing protein [Alphaproteobacteria bacterium]
MSNFSVITLQKSIYEALTNDIALIALIRGVYDHTPQNSAFPYIAFGEVTSREWSNVEDAGMEQQVTLNIWSREGGRKEAISIMERVYTVLHQVSLTIEGQSLVSLRFVTSKVMLGNDGFTYQGNMQFRGLMRQV